MSTTTVQDTAQPESSGRVIANRPGRLSIFLSWPATRALVAVIGLFIVSGIISSGSVSSTATTAMLPFAALICAVLMRRRRGLAAGHWLRSAAPTTLVGSTILIFRP